ncbi:MAG TPA: FtsX-like permease family protein [Actinophytocola sp.]|uniref:FtsX-like permease family protein n=1 Tax=Actinophytocola sp. TaxID=1872138 RepID=UPI002E027074|nr:FtsX-like permease family protein [Actinophytocola sp.]
MRGWLTALRMARREARRAKGRSLLVIGMILLPAAALSFLAVGDDNFTLTPEESADRAMGTAQAVISWPYGGPVQQLHDFLDALPGRDTPPPPAAEPTDEALLALLPAGSRVIPYRLGTLTMRTATGTGTLSARMLDYADPLAQGIYTQLSGRAPANPDEVALTRSAASRLGVDLNGSVSLADGSRTFRVASLVEDPKELKATTIILPPQQLRLSEDRADRQWLAATPSTLTWTQVKELNTHGVTALSRYVLAHTPSDAELYQTGVHRSSGSHGIPPDVFTLVAGVATLEVVLLAGPAFAVGARRRRRELALVAAAGATPAQVRRIVLADGVVLGAVAAVIGAALGIAAGAVLRPVLEKSFGYRAAADFGVSPLAQVILICLAVLTGVLAALVPAWITGRQDVVAALAGRRGITRTRRRWPVLGLVLAAAGIGVVIFGATLDDEDRQFPVILIGVIVFELGLVACTPALVGLVARLSRWTPLALRIALRDTSRNRTAAAPAISAVMAAVVGTIAVGVVSISITAREASESAGQPGDVIVLRINRDGSGGVRGVPADAIERLRTVLPVASAHEINMPNCSGRCFIHPAIPAAIACPYSGDVLGHLPNADEQRAARADRRCDDVRRVNRYFSGTYGTDSGLAVILDDTSASAMVSMPAGDAEAVNAAMRGGAVVVSDARYLESGRALLGIGEIGSDGPERTVTAPGFLLPRGAKAPIAMMTSETARSLGFVPAPFGTLVKTSRMPTVAEEDAAAAVLGTEYDLVVDRGSEPDNQMLIILAIVAAVITLGTAAIATGLMAADGRADLATLGAVGASPRVRKLLSLSQSGVIAGLGSLLGAAAGLGVSTAVLAALNQRFAGIWPAPTPFPIGVPWLNVALAVVAVPVVAMLGAGLLTRARLPIERRE